MRDVAEAIEELKQKYSGEWVAVRVTERNNVWPEKGVLLAHNRDRRDLHRELREQKVRDAYIFFAGPIPKPGYSLQL